MSFFKNIHLTLLVIFAVTASSFETMGATKGDPPPPPRHHGAKKATQANDDDDEASGERHGILAGTFQWVPNFNFVFSGHHAVNDGFVYRDHGDESAAPVASTHPTGSHIGIPIQYNSDQLSQWHQAQMGKLTKAYRAVSERFGRNVAGVMLSLIYKQDEHLFVRNIEIPSLFLSGFSVDDAPIKTGQ